MDFQGYSHIITGDFNTFKDIPTHKHVHQGNQIIQNHLLELYVHANVDLIDKGRYSYSNIFFFV